MLGKRCLEHVKRLGKNTVFLKIIITVDVLDVDFKNSLLYRF